MVVVSKVCWVLARCDGRVSNGSDCEAVGVGGVSGWSVVWGVSLFGLNSGEWVL